MAEKWATKESPKQKGLRGIGTVRVTKTSIKIAFEDNPDVVFDLTPEQCPANVRAGKWFVSLNAKADKMYSFSPVSGAFKCKFIGFASPKDQLPAPQHYTMQFVDKQTGQAGVTEYDAFTALLEIIEGKDAGLVIPYFLRYNFGELEGQVAFVKPKSKYTQQTANFLDATGAFKKGTMTYIDNILPALETRLKEAGYKLMVIMKDGHVDAITALEEVD
jgi:hypothetical protein